MKDTYNRKITYMRLSVTDKCNLRCRYCMPEDGVSRVSHSDVLTEDEMITAVEAAAELGINKLRITGGEPLVKKNILSICTRAAAVKGIEQLCMTTNGILLPELARPLRSAGLSRVNISLDTLDPEKYAYMSRIGSLDKAIAGIEAALDAGFDRVKLNAVLIGGFNDDELRPLAELTKKYRLDMRFIELMPMTENEEFSHNAYVPGSMVTEALPELEPLEAFDGVARLYRLPDALGTVGLINPLSRHFCADCNRIRLTFDGKLKPCLHSDAEYSLKGLDRQSMLQVMRQAIMSKPERHAELSAALRSGAGRNMNAIGG